MRINKWFFISFVIMFILWTLFDISSLKCPSDEKLKLLTNMKELGKFSIQVNILGKLIVCSFVGILANSLGEKNHS